MKPTLKLDGMTKQFRSDNYNYNFNLQTGFFERWGASVEDDPTYSPFGPEIWDAEVSERCNGINGIPCPFCYKGNVGNKGRNMSFETFKTIFDKMPKYDGLHFLTQIAFGIGDIDANPALWEMMNYCNSNGVIPNITINGDRLTDDLVDNLVEKCGAISVSRYDDKNVCYNAVKRLKDAGMEQVNIHQMVSEETFFNCMNVVTDYLKDPRLKDLNAIVFLGLKQKGRGTGFNILPDDKYEGLIRYAMGSNVPIGMDSCSANKAARVFESMGILAEVEKFIEPCESTSMSFYTNVEGQFFPCSFAEDVTKGIDMLTVTDFDKEVWHAGLTCCERKRIQDNGRSCPYFEV
jgi:MoaA/NifB/PqqE/SkfB family radical SAM enzyme